MSIFLLKRFATFILSMLAASLVIFFVLEVMPGSAAEVRLGPTATPEQVAALTHELGLDRPVVVRYADWLRGIATGDLGVSVAYDTPVTQLLAERLAVTAPLAMMAMTLTIVLSLGMGMFAASRHNTLGDVGVMMVSQLGIAIPNVWFGILLILIFAVKLEWVSAGGFPGWDGGFWPALQALLLPTVALATVQTAVLTRITRSAVLEVMREDFVRTARAKGLSRRAVLWRHVLRNAMIPVLTVMGLQFSSLLVGTIVVESVFQLPGLGRLMFQAVSNRDLLVVRNVVMLLAALVILTNLIVDLLYVAIDPRLKAR